MKVSIEETTLSAIGDAIREKSRKNILFTPAKMVEEITALEVNQLDPAEGVEF